MPLATHPDLQIIKFRLNVEGHRPKEIQVEGVDKLDILIPEYSKYTLTIFFKVKNRTLHNLMYTQIFRKAGIIIRQTDLHLGPMFEPSEQMYSKTFDQEETPGGIIFRGSYPAQSIYFTENEELMIVNWKLRLMKKRKRVQKDQNLTSR